MNHSVSVRDGRGAQIKKQLIRYDNRNYWQWQIFNFILSTIRAEIELLELIRAELFHIDA